MYENDHHPNTYFRKAEKLLTWWVIPSFILKYLIILEKLPGYIFSSVLFSSVSQSCPTLCDPMDCSTPGFPVHHQLPELAQTHIHWVSDAIQPSHPLSHCSPPLSHWERLQSFPATGSFPRSRFFASDGQSIGASTSVLPVNIQDWFLLGLTGLISYKTWEKQTILVMFVLIQSLERHHFPNVFYEEIVTLAPKT